MNIEAECRTCKSKTELMKNTTSPNGRITYVCRTCNRTRMRKYYSTDKGSDNIKKNIRNSMDKHPGKQEARVILNFAITKKMIGKPNICSVCGIKSKIDGHHNDYSKPLEVIWLCRVCHLKLHRDMVY